MSTYFHRIHATNLIRLGNLTLTEKNSSLSCKGFDKKRDIYKDSRWEIERELNDFSDWTTAQIEERENKLIDFVKERWKL